eukprot:scaffold135908_cov19-Tisochrysis_lutea.AAC.3
MPLLGLLVTTPVLWEKLLAVFLGTDVLKANIDFCDGVVCSAVLTLLPWAPLTCLQEACKLVAHSKPYTLHPIPVSTKLTSSELAVHICKHAPQL